MDFECYHKVKGADRYSNIKHTLKNRFEIMQIFCNNGNVLAGSKIYPMITGALYLIDCSKPHCTLPAKTNEYVRSKIIANTDSLTHFFRAAQVEETVLEALQNGGMCVVLDYELIQKADQCFYNAYRNSKGRYDPAVILSELLKMILIIKKSAQDTTPHDTGIVGQAVAYIDENLDGHLNVSTIAAQLHVSKYYLCHIFKEKTGMTLSEYTLEKRIAEAKQLLSSTDKSISEIAMDLGFSSFSYFCSVFKKRTSTTPANYRKNNM